MENVSDQNTWEETVKFDKDTVKDYKIIFKEVTKSTDTQSQDASEDVTASENDVVANEREGAVESEDSSSATAQENSEQVPESDVKESEEKDFRLKDLNIDFNVTDISEETKLIIKAYQSGVYDDKTQIEARKKKAEETKLDKYCDDDYFLTDAYYKKYSEKMLMYDNCVILSRNSTKNVIKENEKEADKYAAKYDKAIQSNPKENSNKIQESFISRLFKTKSVSAANLSVIDHSYHQAWQGGGYISNGIWRLSNNCLSFCADGLGAEPSNGSSGPDNIVNSSNLRKALYYGYGGPGDCLTRRLGTSASIAWTDDLVSMAYTGHSVGSVAVGGYHWRIAGQSYWNEIMSKPDPIQYGYVAHVVSINGGGYNWQGIWKAKQPLAYGVYNPKGKLKVQKSSANTSFVSGKSGYTLAGAVYSIYSDSGCTKKVGSVSTDANGKVSFKGLEKGLYTLKEVSAPSGYQLDDQPYLIQINTVKEGESGEAVTANGIGTDEKVLDGKVFVLYNAPETGTMSITKVWDDGEEDRDPASLNIVLTTDKPSQYYASRTITFDANGGNFGGTDKNQVLYGVSKTGQIQTTISGTVLLPTKGVSRFDYWDKTSEAKSYWTTNPDGTGDKFFSVADDVSHVVDKNGNIPLLTHDMVLYAQYQKLDPQLPKGTEFNKLIPEDAVRIEFTDEKAPEDAVLTDVSEGKDGGVVAWSETALDENNDEIKVWKVSSQVKGLKIKFPKECCGMLSTGGLAACKKDLHFKTVDFKNVDTSKTTNLSSMFAAWYSNSTLEHVLNMNQFDTSNVTDMSTMFANCSHLKDVDFSSFDVSKVQSFNNFLYSCGSLTSIDVSGFNTQSAKSLFNMFYGCSGLKFLDVSSFNTLSADDMGGMFGECRGLQTIDITNFDTHNVRNFNNMFFNCRKLKEIKWDNTKFTTGSGIDFGSMFLFDGMLSVPDVSHFNMEKAASINNMFYGTPVEVIDTSKWNAKNITRMDSMFRACGNLKSVDLTGINTSKATNMSFLFDGCGKLANIKGLSNFNTSNVTDMTGMFAGVNGITELDISNFDTSKVVKFGDSTPYSAIGSYGQPGMFQGCNNLRTLHIGEMDLSSAKNFSRMFSGCDSLETIDGTFINGNVVEDLNTMFTGCRQLQTIDISGLNVANATNTKYMFYGCSLLETIISNNFETVSITDDQEMFAQCPNLPNFDTAQTGSSMAVSQEEGGYLTKPKQKSSVVSDAVQKLASLLS